jgi:hypothetical protein
MKRIFFNKNEDGSVLVIALIMLAVLTLMGVVITRTSDIELQITGNEKFYKMAFFAAEAARGYVVGNPDLWGIGNVTLGGKLYFPNNADPTENYSLGSDQSFRGDVEYLGFSAPPRGSGYEVGKFKAHRYAMTCRGTGPSNAESEIEAGFYRIGF